MFITCSSLIVVEVVLDAMQLSLAAFYVPIEITQVRSTVQLVTSSVGSGGQKKLAVTALLIATPMERVGALDVLLVASHAHIMGSMFNALRVPRMKGFIFLDVFVVILFPSYFHLMISASIVHKLFLDALTAPTMLRLYR